MIAILYDESGYFIGTSAYLTEEDDIQLPHFFVEKILETLMNIPEGHRAKINPVTREVFYEAQPTAPNPGPTVEERITFLEQQLTVTQVVLTESNESNLITQSEVTSLQVALTEVYERLLILTGGDS
ncbi:MAG: hypothetical protein K0Q90_334 [Paenibacillaceae bacterium]|jgi:uncharacterized coiled-coil protein SlyX|nr:hypothetical protein [Paenibacillaceae bacterium]